MQGTLRWAAAVVSLVGGVITLPAGQAADLPPYMAPIAGTVTTTPAEIADQNLLALNVAMFDLYAAAGAIFQRNILARHPVILGLFSGAGGRFILYRPGQPPLEAPPVPMVYQLMKSTGHSTMALTRSGLALSGEPAEPGVACIAGGLSEPDAIGAGHARCRCDAGRLASHRPHHPAEQRRLHG